MPGPVSDSYHREFVTGHNAAMVREAVQNMYDTLTLTLSGKKPEWIVNIAERLAHPNEDQPLISGVFTEDQWRVLRFACESALESL